MMTNQSVGRSDSLYKFKANLATLVAALVLPAILQTEAASTVVVWDTGARLSDAADVQGRADWKRVPSELFSMEADPPKAASDPGYYGMEYSFKGDAVVENRSLVAVFRSTKGRIEIYTKDNPAAPGDGAASGGRPARKVAEIVPSQMKTRAARIGRVEILRNTDDEAALQVSFSANGADDASVMFSFDNTEIVEIKPAEHAQGVSVLSPIEYGVAPGFIGDDLIYSAAEHTSAASIHVPAEHVFVGLLAGEDAEIVMTWPEVEKPVSLALGNEPQGKRLIESVNFDGPGQSIYVAALTAPGIWHKER